MCGEEAPRRPDLIAAVIFAGSIHSRGYVICPGQQRRGFMTSVPPYHRGGTARRFGVFTETYASGSAVSHVGIYVGGGRMLHAGDPIGYADLNAAYWRRHLYGYGRLF